MTEETKLNIIPEFYRVENHGMHISTDVRFGHQEVYCYDHPLGRVGIYMAEDEIQICCKSDNLQESCGNYINFKAKENEE